MPSLRTAWLSLTLGAAVVVAGCSSTTGGQGSAAVPPSSPVAQSPELSSAPAPSSAAPSAASPSDPATSTPPTSGAVITPTTTPAGFVGTWTGHGRHLVVTAAGQVTFTFRTYVNCTATVTTGCDQITGSVIYDGGHATGHITEVLNPTTVIVTIASSTVTSAVPLGPVRMGHDLTHDAVAVFAGEFSGVPFCGPASLTGYCGA